MRSELEEIALKIFNLCIHNCISLEVEWVPRELNNTADLYSKLFDINDCYANDVYSKYFNSLLGPFYCDVFADYNIHKLPIFFSAYFCPDTSGVAAFGFSWNTYNCWLVPPIHLVSDIFKQKTELEQKNRSLDLKVTQLTHRVEGYESAMHISTKKATIKVGLEILTGDVDKRMKQQIDLYEVLTLMTEERVDEWSDTEKSTTLEEIKNFFSEEPPSTIKQHIKEVTELFKDKHIPALMSETDESMVGELEHEPQNSQATIEDMKTMDGQESEENF
ncbi:unnamed protein product [Mytilus coruscus]|uniref:RNase H type-1 domain-containing protein n=1 Tax=Mytilus coruscus TaxID=42192 RepID=A0A6J8B5N6_MYTCO|nr:unnamed protein product [Mytilus coruscus]